MTDAATFVATRTRAGRVPAVPEIELRLAAEVVPIWEAAERFLGRTNVPPPYWAFAWAGSQLLARHILDHPGTVRGRRVLDFAAGSGLAAIAAARSGAAAVEAADIDPIAIAAIRINAAANGAAIAVTEADLVGSARSWDLILCGDVCYEVGMTGHILPWLHDMRRAGAEVWIADPGRGYLPAGGLTPVFGPVPIETGGDAESRKSRLTTIYALG